MPRLQKSAVRSQAVPASKVDERRQRSECHTKALVGLYEHDAMVSKFTHVHLLGSEYEEPLRLPEFPDVVVFCPSVLSSVEVLNKRI